MLFYQNMPNSLENSESKWEFLFYNILKLKFTWLGPILVLTFEF